MARRIDEAVAGHAARTPEAIAVQQGDRVLSYADLHARAGRVAAGLAGRGIGGGDFVPVAVQRSPDLVVALLGVLRAGAAYIAVDLAWPVDRLAAVIRSAGAGLAVGDRPVGGVPTIGVIELADAEGPVPEPPAEGAEAASVFYTSGSTGRPKGVVAPHLGTLRVVQRNPDLPFDATTVLLQAAPPAWDAMSLELWAPLVNGGRVVLLGTAAPALDAAALRTELARGVNTLWLTSSLCNVLIDEAPELLGGLRLLMTGGERLSAPHMRKLAAHHPDLPVVNGYGPVESTIFATTHRIRREDLAAESTEIPIGRPVPETGILLLDPDRVPVAEGEIGEIAISGSGLGAGYLGDPDETARRFVVVAGQRHYLTGDLALRGDDGLLRFRGRADRQLKIRGVRVEPGEVEAVFTTYPEIASCAVVPVERAPGRVELGCAYTTVHGGAADESAAREFAGRSLLPAMMPTLFRHVPVLPLGATGKTDDAAVALLLTTAPAVSADPAGTDLLSRVRDLLALPGLGADDDLVEAGATSLDLIRLAGRAEGWLGTRVTIADIYRLRTIRDIGAAARNGPTAGPTLPAPTALPHGPIPLSHAQFRFWMAEQAAPGAADNMIVAAYLITGPLDRAALGDAIRDTIARHAVLRTVYPWSGDLPEQRILAPDEALIDLAEVALPEGTEPAAAAELLGACFWKTPFDLVEDVPIRARIGRLDVRRHVLCLNLHHIAFDGWSESLLVDDLRASYRRRLAGTPPAPVGATTFAHYSLWESRNLPGWIRGELPYWRRTLAYPVPPVLPAPSLDGEPVRRESRVRVPAEVVRRAGRAAADMGGPPVSALLAATGRALGRQFGTDDVCLGTATAGRFDPALESLIGYFVNTLAIPLTGATREPGALLARAAQRVTEALAHARIPFDEVVRALQPGRGRHPFFQAWAVLQRRRPTGELAGGAMLTPLRVPPPTTAIELMVEAEPEPSGEWMLTLLHRADGLGEQAAAQVLEAVHHGLAELGHGG
ncbi:amino acid adenylation domain-containing protein [Micromonospora parva]|uniref:amino acid adenylation domain-containing protein n=1 Tax=Micromonospora parva TaxID=1464048 RepID=UPI0033ED8C45